MKILIVILFILTITQVLNRTLAEFVLDESDSIDITYGNQQRLDDNLCYEGFQCTALNNCRLLKDLMGRTCLETDKLRDLTCGYKGSEPLVCCPSAAYDSPFDDNGDDSSSSASTSGQKLNCGQPDINTLKSGLGSQPWVARVGYRNVKTGITDYPCCGSIISEREILTAAHCALAKSDGHKLHSVRVGEYDGKGDPDCTTSFCAHVVQDVAIEHVIVHPGFENNIFKDDVAIIVLKSPLNFSVAAQPVCLLQNPSITLIGRRASLVGWGKLPGQNVTPSREQLLELPILALDQCTKVYGRVIPVTDKQLCVGGEQGKDACSGFGGAPLILLDHIKRDRYYQVGIASFGSDKCGTIGIPSVYTSITKYIDWIHKNML